MTDYAQVPSYYIVPKRLREDVVTTRMRADERQMLAELAEEDGIALSQVIRMLVRRAHAERFGKKKAKGR
ncbi:MAG TPA: hypothetical protein VIF62_37560 [Labilithrix sp.]